MWGEGRWREKKRRRENLPSEPSWMTKKGGSPPCPSRCPHQTLLNSPRAFILAPEWKGRGLGEDEARTSSSLKEQAADKDFSAWI